MKISWQYFLGFIIVMSALFVLASFIGTLIKTRFSGKKINRLLLRYNGFSGNLLAALVGIITPFCSCTTVPIFTGLLESNINFGVAMSFLIASPSMNLAAMILLSALFGIKTAVFYILACFVIAVLGGYFLGKLNLKDQFNDTFRSLQDNCKINTWKEALVFSLKSLRYFIFILIIAALVGALIYNYVPQELLYKLTMGNNIWLIPVVVLIGALIYADVVLLIPIGFALLAKGVNQGIVFAFMISAAGISLPSVLLLSRIIKVRSLIYFITILISLFTLLGFTFYFL